MRAAAEAAPFLAVAALKVAMDSNNDGVVDRQETRRPATWHFDETPLFIPGEAPYKVTGGCHQMTVSSMATRACSPLRCQQKRREKEEIEERGCEVERSEVEEWRSGGVEEWRSGGVEEWRRGDD